LVCDRLKITIFESVGVALHDGATASDQAVATVFPRMDLSAEYAVDESGNVTMPRLGVFPVVGQTFADLQFVRRSRFERTTGRTSDIQLAANIVLAHAEQLEANSSSQRRHIEDEQIAIARQAEHEVAPNAP